MKKVLCLSIYAMVIVLGSIVKEIVVSSYVYITGFIFGCLSLAVLQFYDQLD